MAKVAFLGLGVMGFPMAGHLQAAGHDVTVYNRTTAKAEAWSAQHGGAHAVTPREAATGAEIDELPVLQWQQGDAEFHGLEADIGWRALNWDNGTLEFNAGYDYVRARLDSGENRNLPRIPPHRWRIGALLNWQDLLAEVSWGRVDAQNDTAAEALPTEAYNDLRVHLAYALNLGGNRLELFVTGRNLTDDEQRYHTSFIKDFAPQPGRTIEGGVILRL